VELGGADFGVGGGVLREAQGRVGGEGVWFVVEGEEWGGAVVGCKGFGGVDLFAGGSEKEGVGACGGRGIGRTLRVIVVVMLGLAGLAGVCAVWAWWGPRRPGNREWALLLWSRVPVHCCV
jgi:hypothetical protein